jgi:AraC-like DNA-binding protein
MGPPALEPWSATPSRRPPLANVGVCRSDDLDVFRAHVNDLFYPARVETLRPRARLEGAWLSGIRLRHLTLGFVRVGADTSVDCGPLGYYHVNVPYAGRVQSACGEREEVARPGVGTCYTPAPYTVLPRWSADAAKLCIKIPRESLESELEGLLGHPVSSWVDFRFAVDYSTPAARSWLATLGLLLAELERPGSLVQASTPYREHLERLVIGGLLLAQPNEFTAELRFGQRPARPRTVGRVVALIEEHPERHYTVGDLARHAGVSARRLQQGFREHVGMTPMEFVRATRLERARRDLREGDGSVTDVALRWGFNHPGRFADAYRDRFGELPSETRRGLDRV